MLEDARPYLLDDAVREVFDVSPTQAALEELLSRALEVLPVVAEARLVHHLAGVRPLSPDRWPLVGRVPGWENVYLATGHGHRGIHLAALTGRLVADLVLRGTTDLPVALERLDPARFGRGPISWGEAPRVADD